MEPSSPQHIGFGSYHDGGTLSPCMQSLRPLIYEPVGWQLWESTWWGGNRVSWVGGDHVTVHAILDHLVWHLSWPLKKYAKYDVSISKRRSCSFVWCPTPVCISCMLHFLWTRYSRLAHLYSPPWSQVLLTIHPWIIPNKYIYDSLGHRVYHQQVTISLKWSRLSVYACPLRCGMSRVSLSV